MNNSNESNSGTASVRSSSKKRASGKYQLSARRPSRKRVYVLRRKKKREDAERALAADKESSLQGNQEQQLHEKAPRTENVQKSTLSSSVAVKEILIPKNEQTKTGGGQCSMALTPCEEQVSALSLNTIVGFESSFDKENAEPGSSGLKHWTLQDAVENEPEASVAEENIIFLDDENYDLFQCLKTTESVQIIDMTLTSPEKSARIVETSSKRKIAAVDFDKETKTRKGPDAKFIVKNKRTKISNDNSAILKEKALLEKEILVLQEKLLKQEMEAKTEITKLIIENLNLDAEIKRLTLQKLDENVFDDDQD